MSVSNHERVRLALETLRKGLGPFVERELEHVYHDLAKSHATQILREDRPILRRPIAEWDASALLRVMFDSWNDVFRKSLGNAERSLVQELRDFRNKLAHQEAFSLEDTHRVIDSVGRLLNAVAAPGIQEIEVAKREVLRLMLAESTGTALHQATPPAPARSTQRVSALYGRASKYNPLREFLATNGTAALTLPFAQIEAIIGGPLPRSARTYQAWWANQNSGKAAVQCGSWMSAGYEVDAVDFVAQSVRFRKR